MGTNILGPVNLPDILNSASYLEFLKIILFLSANGTSSKKSGINIWKKFH